MAAEPRARAVRTRAFAKINLSLEIVGRLPDGYHELRTVFQSLALHDTLTFRRSDGPFRIACSDPACPTDSANLVWRAAERVWAAARRRAPLAGVAVRITKRIPLEAGLGGGSSDAAAAIRALDALWGLRLSRARMRRIAASLGADVPYFLEGGTVLGTGRGDKLRPLANAAPAWVVLTIPPFGVSTKEAYGWFDQAVTASSISRGAPPPLADASRAPSAAARRHGAWPHALLSSAEIPNDLQMPVAARHPEIARLVDGLRRAGAAHAAMSGSGSAVFGLFARRADAAAAARLLGRRGRTAILTRMLHRGRYGALTKLAR